MLAADQTHDFTRDENAGVEDPRRVAMIRPAVLNPLDAAKYIGIGKSKLFELLKAGAIPFRKSGKHTLIKVSDLDAWIDSLPTERKPA